MSRMTESCHIRMSRVTYVFTCMYIETTKHTKMYVGVGVGVSVGVGVGVGVGVCVCVCMRGVSML